MAPGSRFFALAVALLVFTSATLADDDTPSSHYAGYQYSVESPSQGYASPPAPDTSYSVPSPSPVYGPPPAPSYGTPYGDHGYALDSESPFVQQRLFNTAVALTIPLFSFTLPQRSSNNGGIDLANQVIFGVFVLVATIFVFVVPILFTKPPGAEGRSNDRNGLLNNLMANNKVFNFMNSDVSNKIGLDTSKCLQKTICEAHREPKKYGVMSSPFLMFFPPPTNGTSVSKSSIFQLAAKDGKYSKKACGSLYKCFFDVMDMSSYLVDWWQHSGDPNYMLHF